MNERPEDVAEGLRRHVSTYHDEDSTSIIGVTVGDVRRLLAERDAAIAERDEWWRRLHAVSNSLAASNDAGLDLEQRLAAERARCCLTDFDRTGTCDHRRSPRRALTEKKKN